MFEPNVIVLIILSALIFWVGIFVFTSNPFSTLSRIGSALIFVSSAFLITGAFLFSAGSLEEYRLIFRLSAFTMYMSAILWFHISVLLSGAEVQKKWFGVVTVGYFFGILLSILEPVTNLVFDYENVIAPVSRYKFIFAKGPLFYPAVIFILSYASLATFNLSQLYKNNKNRPESLIKFLFPIVASLSFTVGFLMIVTSFAINDNRVFKSIGEAVSVLSVVLLATSVFINRLFLEGWKASLGREFVYSTIAVFIIVALYVVMLLLFQFETKANVILFVSTLIFLLLATHTLYDWLMSFIRNIFYQGQFSLPLITDEEVNISLRSINRPEKLEASVLIRLKLVEDGPSPSVDKLRLLLKESIAYLKPDGTSNRTRARLKHQILEMVADQIEEGQILWDLGFEEYPLGIAENSEGQKPRFAVSSPTDYQAISRNAFISLKKEAIHDLAWRISYLEKRLK